MGRTKVSIPSIKEKSQPNLIDWLYFYNIITADSTIAATIPINNPSISIS